MPAKRSSLGRGLDALLPKPVSGVQQMSIGKLAVSEYQPRKTIDLASIADLAASVAEKGILQPLLVRPAKLGYEIIAGERRYRAAKQAGLSEVPVIIKELSDQETLEIAIIENLQREDLNAVEEARAFKQLMAFGLNQEDVSKAVGKSRSSIANTLRLLKLPPNALKALEHGTITPGHARAILALNAEDREWALEQIVNRNLSVRQAETLERIEKKPIKQRTRQATILEEDLTRHVGTKVKVKGANKGKLELYYHSKEELERLLSLMGYEA